MALRGKLVRDRIPEIIRASGREPRTYEATSDEYRQRRLAKLQEEVDELLGADERAICEELVDVLEVVRALAIDIGVAPEQLERLRARKADAKGGFGGRIVWTGNL